MVSTDLTEIDYDCSAYDDSQQNDIPSDVDKVDFPADIRTAA